MSSESDLSQSLRTDELAAAIAWLTDGARSAVRSHDVLEQLCLRLATCGLPLWRVAVFVRTLHPLVMGRSFVWRPDREVEVSEAPFQLLDDTAFLTSPVKFIGDGLLAVFRTDDSADADSACARALRAARAAQTNIAALPVTGADEPLRFGLALHVGEALYGNIGAGARLDFTCIGPSVNRAARLEKIASRLGKTVVASAAFARRLSEEFVALGDFELAGFRGPETVFGLRGEPT